MQGKGRTSQQCMASVINLPRTNKTDPMCARPCGSYFRKKLTDPKRPNEFLCSLFYEGWAERRTRKARGQFLKHWLASGRKSPFATSVFARENLQRVPKPLQLLTCEHSQLCKTTGNFFFEKLTWPLTDPSQVQNQLQIVQETRPWPHRAHSRSRRGAARRCDCVAQPFLMLWPHRVWIAAPRCHTATCFAKCYFFAVDAATLRSAWPGLF